MPLSSTIDDSHTPILQIGELLRRHTTSHKEFEGTLSKVLPLGSHQTLQPAVLAVAKNLSTSAKAKLAAHQRRSLTLFATGQILCSIRRL